MMIRAENLGKRYVLGSETTSYATLRDVVSNSVKSLGRGARPREEFWAVRDVSFQVEAGEVLGVIGRNGAGKSTLLKLLSRITEPTTGEIDLYGRVASLLEVGTGFHPELSGRENIFLNGAILGMSRHEIARRFDEIVAFSEVEKFLDTPVKRYSSGMYTRLAFAVAAHLEPEILIVDEVLAVGDAQFQKKCLGKVGEVARAGRTVLMVSHNLTAIQAFCGRVLLMENGRAVFEGAPETAIERYLKSATDAQHAVIELANHPARCTPPENAVFERLRLLDHNGEPTSTFAFNSSITFEITLLPGERVFQTPAIVLIIEKRGARVCNLSTYLMHPDSFSLQGGQTVSCTWNLGRLAPGTYSIERLNFRLGKNQSVDLLENVSSFEIGATDVFGTGRTAPDRALLVPDGKWYFGASPTL